MCAIIGIASRTPVSDNAWLIAGRDAMRHRGPDDTGHWWASDGRVGLGHRRLSIIDLTPAGHQPMHDGTGELSIVFNGEIYNFTELREELAALGYRFRSRTDTEIILAAYRRWGEECFVRFNGMFALALYDVRQRRLLLVRDRAGEKPLYYHHANGTLRFASELKALLADKALSRRINAASLDSYLAMGYVPGGHCILQGFNKLPPAHALRFDLQTGKVRVWRYWKLPEAESAPAEGRMYETELLNELETILQGAVRRQLLAEVPLGVLLSGGVDSSLITALAARAAPTVKTFTVRFPGYGAYDETHHARLIARHFETQHIELDAGEIEVDLLLTLARQFDEPLVDSSMIPTFLVSQLVRRYCTVALGGDGGDELFGGYQHYSRLMWLRANLSGIPRPVRRMVAAIGETLLPVGFKGRNWLQSLGEDLERSLPLVASYFDQTTRRRLLGSAWKCSAESDRSDRVPVTHDLLARATRLDFETYLPEDILVKVDRASMLNSLEVRAPMLDYRLIEFAFGKVPSYLKATARERKILLKRLAARVLPKEFDLQRKQGFSIPLSEWLRKGKWLDLFKSVLLDHQTIFDRATVTALFKGQARGRANSERLFALTLFELWRREYRATLS